MVSNWSHTCKLLFPEEKLDVNTDDMQAVQVLTKNIKNHVLNQWNLYRCVNCMHVNKIVYACMHALCMHG